jgi:hypothetical protein
MPDVIEPTVETPTAPTSFSQNDIAKRYANVDFSGRGGTPDPVPEVEPEPEPEPTKSNEPKIPDSVLGIEPEKKAEEDILNELPKGPVKHEHFKRVQEKAKAEIAAEKARVTEIQKEVERLRKLEAEDYIPDRIKKEYEALRQRDQEREDEIRRLDVQHSTEFKEKFTNRQNSVDKLLKTVAGELEIPNSTIDALRNASPKKRTEIFDALETSESSKSQIINLLQKNDEIELEKQDFMANWKEQAEKLEQERTARDDSRKAKLKEHEDRIFNGVLENYRKTNAVFQRIEGNDAWNAQAERLEAEATRFYNGEFSDEEAADWAISGPAGKIYYQMFEVARAKVQELSKEIAALKAAGPTIPPVGGKPPKEDLSKLSLTQRFEKTFNEMTGRSGT